LYGAITGADPWVEVDAALALLAARLRRLGAAEPRPVIQRQPAVEEGPLKGAFRVDSGLAPCAA
jgi:hypothetical protein